MLRSRLLLLSGFAIGGGFYACSSFGGTGSAAPDAATPTDAGPKNDAAKDASVDAPTDIDGSAIDPCQGEPDTYEFAGLYVIGGLGSFLDGGYDEPQDILRAGIHCDGSLASEWTLAGTLPPTNPGYPNGGRPFPAVGLWNRTLVVLGGNTSFGGSAFSPIVLTYAVQDDGRLAIPGSQTFPPIDTYFWRSQAATIGSVLLTGGGDGLIDADVDGGVDGTRAITALWELSTGAPVLFGAPDPFPTPTDRAGAIVSGNDIYEFGGAEGAVYHGVLANGGVLHWQSTLAYGDSDFALAASDDAIYVLGGDTYGSTVTILPKMADGALGPQYAAPMLSSIYLSCGAYARGHLYIAGAAAPVGTNVFSAAATSTGLSQITMGPSLPENRSGCAAVVVPIAN